MSQPRPKDNKRKIDESAPVLTAGMTEMILGDTMGHTLVANCQLHEPFWTRNSYNGFDAPGFDNGLSRIGMARDYLESQKWFAPRKLAAIAVKAFDPAQYRGAYQFIENPTYSRDSYCLATTFIAWNPTTHAFEKFPGGWMVYAPGNDMEIKAKPKTQLPIPAEATYAERNTHRAIFNPAVPMYQTVYTPALRAAYRKHNFWDAIAAGLKKLTR